MMPLSREKLLLLLGTHYADKITLHGNCSWEWQAHGTRRQTRSLRRHLIHNNPKMKVHSYHCNTIIIMLSHYYH